jgi:energy-converting hydrogenase Eha subunit G
LRSNFQLILVRVVYGVIWQPLASLTALATVGAGALVYRYGVRARANPEPRA